MSPVKSMLALVALAVMLLVTVGLLHLRYQFNQPLHIPPAGLILDVPSGTSLQALAVRLAKEGTLDSPLTMALYGRLSGQARRIKAGEYDLAPGVTPSQLLQRLVEGRVRLHSLTIVEGWTVHDLLKAVGEHPAIRRTLRDSDSAALVRTFNLPASDPEGWFFPDTYHFPRGTSDVEVLRQAHERMRMMLDRIWAQRGKDLPLHSEYEALILASIVEKETAFDPERPRISGVFLRRLQAGMRLQTDPTVIYGLGDRFDGNLTRHHLESDTPFNTYTRNGLPPSPISLPGEQSLLAAVRPDESRALFFVASGNGDGSHVFSETLDEHNSAVRRYLGIARSHGR